MLARFLHLHCHTHPYPRLQVIAAESLVEKGDRLHAQTPLERSALVDVADLA